MATDFTEETDKKRNTAKVSRRHQITIPVRAREALGIKAGDELSLVVGEGMLMLVPLLDDYVGAMTGLHREIWQGIDTTAYLREERRSWGDKPGE